MAENDCAAKLARLTVGDIFHARSANAPSLICLVTSTTATTIEARSVTMQIAIEFDRSTGVGKATDDLQESLIDSITPLPVDIHNVSKRPAWTAYRAAGGDR
jgi:hypothetical protein